MTKHHRYAIQEKKRLASLLCLFLLGGSLLLGVPISSSSHFSSALANPQFKLLVTPRPPVLPADNGTYSALVLEFVNVTSGLPSIPTKNIGIELSSSNASVGNVSSSIVFPAGQVSFTVNFTTTCCAGTTVITALSNNTMASVAGQATVQTQVAASQPYKLAVYMSPKSLPAVSDLTSAVVVQVQGPYGNPVKLAKNVNVALSSSNLTVGSTPTFLTIPSGASFANSTFTATNTNGNTTITAHADGLQPAYAQMQTFAAVSATTLSVQAAPTSVIADSEAYNAVIVIQLTDSAGTPTVASSPVLLNITLTSCTGKLTTEKATIPAGESYVRIGFDSEIIAGSALIVASSPGYNTGTANLRLVTPAATNLKLYVAPNVILAGSQTFANLIAVQLQDSQGHPAKTYRNIFVELGTSSTLTGAVYPSLTINAGQTFGLVNFTTTSSPGAINVTAIASDLVSNSLLFNSTLLPINSAVNDSNTFVPLHGSLLFNLNLTSEGVPVPSATVTWSAPGGEGSFQTRTTTTNALGETSGVYLPGNVLGAITLTVQVSKFGYSVPNIELSANVYDPSMVATLKSSPSLIPTSSTSNLTLLVTSGGSPLVNATVEWSASNGTVFNAQTLTNSNGSVEAEYQARSIASSDQIQAKIMKAGYDTFLANDSVSVFVPTFTVQNALNPSSVQAGHNFSVSLQVVALGEPASGASLSWKASFAKVLSSDLTTNASGYANATFTAGADAGAQRLQVEITSSGIAPYLDNVSVDVYQSNMTLVLSEPHPSIVTSYASSFSIQLTSNGKPVSNVSLSWSVKSGTLSSAPKQTNGTGYASATFVSPSSAGNFTVLVVATKLGYANVTRNVYFLVVARSLPSSNGGGTLNANTDPLYTKVGNVLPIWALIPVLVAAAGVGFFVFKRFRGGSGYYDDE